MRDPSPFAWPRLADDGVTPLGIDLTARAHEVRKLILAGFRPPPEVDVEDLIQDTLLAIHRKNRQACAFDPRRAGFAKYVHRVATCQLCNALATLRRFPRPLGADDLGYPLDVEDPTDRAAALAEADEATANLDGSRELGAIIPRAPRPIWRIALAQRKAEKKAEARAAVKRDEAKPWQIVLFTRAQLSGRSHRGSLGGAPRAAGAGLRGRPMARPSAPSVSSM